jgi:1,4-dihydroxy-6-naphthoate synthase
MKGVLIMTDETNVTTHIKVAHSPDSDDAFMFYGLSIGAVDMEGLTFEHHLSDIQTLNQEALKGTYELTAISYAAYPAIHDTYQLSVVGSSIGDKYGPILVAKEKFSKQQLKTKKIAVPGFLTTAYMALKIWEPDLQPVEVPFDQIVERVLSGEFDAGLIIHEGQLTYAAEGLQKIVDLGEWWYEDTNLPLPLGGNAIRRDLGAIRMLSVARVLRRGIQYSLDNRKEALAYAMKYSRGLTTELADRFVGMYVNDMTLEADLNIQRAVKLLLWRGYSVGVLTEKIEPDFLLMNDPTYRATSCCG